MSRQLNAGAEKGNTPLPGLGAESGGHGSEKLCCVSFPLYRDYEASRPLLNSRGSEKLYPLLNSRGSEGIRLLTRAVPCSSFNADSDGHGSEKLCCVSFPLYRDYEASRPLLNGRGSEKLYPLFNGRGSEGIRLLTRAVPCSSFNADSDGQGSEALLFDCDKLPIPDGGRTEGKQPFSAASSGQAGFTLLEVLVATMIMAIAVVGLLGNLHTSMRNTDKLSDYDRASLFAQHKMDELLLEPGMPPFAALNGLYLAGEDPDASGWRAVVKPYEYPPNAQGGMTVLAQVRLEVWWMRNGERRTFVVDGFRRAVLSKDDAGRIVLNEHGANL